MELYFSLIVPVFNRPDEVKELLESLTLQTDKRFEVVIVEDGSTRPCKEICDAYKERLDICYLDKPNSGRSKTRNFGMDHASGNYFIIFDSDCIMPPHYIETVRTCLEHDFTDCFGGPDSSDSSFSNLQKAISYSMTSFMTTGGIRGGMKNVNKFTPRSFNMGISKACYEKVGGFKDMIGEDIDMSFRIRENGFKPRLLPEAFVCHKRRSTLKGFFRQVRTFGRGRILLNKMHPGALKLVHMLPAAFAVGNVLLLLAAALFQSWYWLLPIAVYVLCIFMESLIRERSVRVAVISIAAAYVQLFGYGIGFIDECITHKASRTTQEKLY
ncbi:MAG: glycosyltransferase [Bacteroidaceae bacterium]|nr:glycosyltransferase [Bacteroidaceae bacterium]